MRFIVTFLEPFEMTGYVVIDTYDPEDDNNTILAGYFSSKADAEAAAAMLNALAASLRAGSKRSYHGSTGSL